MPDDKTKPRSGSRAWGIGVELAGAVAGLTLLGYWIDRHYGSHPWGLLIGLALGLVGGMYNLIRESLLASKDAGRGAGRGKPRNSGEDR
jgi:F0F1-type ATP synthase assembly protein I